MFDDCCLDAPPSLTQLQRQFSPSEFTCVPERRANGYMGYVVIDSCPEGAADAELCHQGEIGEWSPFGWLVSAHGLM